MNSASVNEKGYPEPQGYEQGYPSQVQGYPSHPQATPPSQYPQAGQETPRNQYPGQIVNVIPQPQAGNVSGQYYPQPQAGNVSGQYYPQPQAGNVSGQDYRNQLFQLCAQGQHERKTEYGIFGVIMAIIFFPFGLICLFTDTNVRCSRCGVSLPK